MLSQIIAPTRTALKGRAQRRGDLATAHALLSDALELAELCGEKRLIGSIQQNLGIVADIRGDFEGALARYRVAQRIFEAGRDEQRLCWLLVNLGYLHVRQHRFDAASATFARALGIARERGDLMSEGVIEENRAEALLLSGETDAAYDSVRRALEIAELRRDDVRRATALKLRGAYERLIGRPSAAVETLRHSLTLSTLGEDALLGAEVLYQFGAALDASGDHKMAHDVWQTALDAFQRISAKDWIKRVQDVLTDGLPGRYL